MSSTKRWTLLTVCLATFMLLLDITVVNVALPDIQRELHASFTDLQWVVDAYSLMLATVLLTAGSLADLLGRRASSSSASSSSRRRRSVRPGDSRHCRSTSPAASREWAAR